MLCCPLQIISMDLINLNFIDKTRAITSFFFGDCLLQVNPFVTVPVLRFKLNFKLALSSTYAVKCLFDFITHCQ